MLTQIRDGEMGIRHVGLKFCQPKARELEFNRADLVFNGVDHSASSFEVRVFLNNTDANRETPRGIEEGYAGRFTIFGHGGCFGDEGHCDVPQTGRLAAQHPLAPQRVTVPITKALQRLLIGKGNQLETVTLVPIITTEAVGQAAEGPLEFEGVSLRTYR